MEQEKYWDEVYRLGNSWKKETLNLPKIFKSKKVLELGVGNGKTLKSILRQKPKMVCAIDISGEAIKMAKNLYEKESVDILKSDVTKLPFEDNSFDIVVCYYVLNNLNESDCKKAILEIYRVLNKNGIVVFEDFSVGDFRETEGKLKFKHTIEKKNGISCHFFQIGELKELFNIFSKINLENKISSPIKSKNNIKRILINGIIVK